MDKKLQAMLASYGRSFLAAVTTAFMITGGDLLALDGDSLKAILAAGVAAVLPVAIRAANPKDPAFGKIADGVTEAVVGKLTKKAPAKKATAEK
ncbi:hypothetical protein uvFWCGRAMDCOMC203_061 [Freshwater phage uvFW-CGR-AMD-COM-C203]|nr:hypothetical protein uvFWCGRAMDCOMC203_061 [Freshwater phage uvFW-CGR-AMD-COM-C203]